MKFSYQESDIPKVSPSKYALTITHETETLPATNAKVVEVAAGNTTINVMIINHGEGELNLHQGDRVDAVRESQQPEQTTAVSMVPITEEMVQRGPAFTQDEVNDLVALLNKYRCCFAFNLGELGCTTEIKMDIVDNGQHIVCKLYRASASERETISRIVREWKDAGKVKETNSLLRMHPLYCWSTRRMVMRGLSWITRNSILEVH